MKYGNRLPRRRFFSSPLALVGLLVVFFFLAKAAWSIHEKALLSAARLENARVELAKLEAHQRDLASQINYLSTEQGIEAELRTKFRAVKEDESVAVIVDNQSAAVALVATTTTAVNVTPASLWQRMLRFVGI